MELARFAAFIIQIGFTLALIGELKTCTLQLMNKAAVQTEHGIMSYSKFNRKRTNTK
jgi:hypothetical protein